MGGNIWCGSATQAHANFGDWRVRSRSAPAKSVPCEGERSECLQCYQEHGQARLRTCRPPVM